MFAIKFHLFAKIQFLFAAIIILKYLHKTHNDEVATNENSFPAFEWTARVCALHSK